ncbi:MAG: hypothetical protein PHU49_06820 [Syntrophorhabdaceae bacterium]|nr:hypothetical protein [Syntrophorhabdaceae bacterium]
MKTQPIQIRVSPNEKIAFNEAAKVVGISLSSWIRACLRRAAIRELEEVGKQAAFLKEGDLNE